ncbi:MAG: ATP-binding cassette domain-containing protein [Alphaproteobacteria bacterium]|nr:ATP-binding cassette domain-containing protein [Alphaproteobacteria bacterium]
MTDAVLTVRGLRKHFTVKRGFPRTVTVTVKAVDDVSFEVRPGEAFGLVGESGCGKSTTGRALLRLIEPDDGEILYRGENVRAAEGAALRALRRKLQIVFQDPFSSLNPRRKVGQALAEPIEVHGLARSRAEVDGRVAALLAEVGLPAAAADRYPHEFSGGQRQRIGIARALSLEPELIVADEPVSALDVSIQAQVLELLRGLQARRGLAFVFIAHDLGVVRYFCQRLAVMYLGRIVEVGTVDELFAEPLHPYTRMLRDASPIPDPTMRGKLPRIEGETPSAANPPSGCHFHPRCPHAKPVCREIYPKTTIVGGRQVACHLHGGT